MKRPLLATATLAAVGCSLLLAGPAHAATAPSTSAPGETVAPHAPAFPSLGIVLDSYDPTTRVATVTVTGTYSTQVFSVIHKADVDGRATSIGFDIVHVKDDSGSWTGTVHDIYKGESIEIKEGLQAAADSVTIEEGPALPASTVTTTVKDGIVSGTYIHGRSGWTSIYDADDHEVAFTARATQLADGSYQTNFTIPDTGRTSEFTAQASNASGIRSVVRFTINAGMTALAVPAPSVGSVDPAGTRALAAVTGEPGATVTVNDADDKTVAVKILGTSGTAQVIVPASTTRTANAFTVTQTAGGAISAPTPFTA